MFTDLVDASQNGAMLNASGCGLCIFGFVCCFACFLPRHYITDVWERGHQARQNEDQIGQLLVPISKIETV